MVALADYQKIVIKGTGPGSEIWQTGFSTVVTTPITTQSALQSYLNSIVPFVSTWWTSIKVGVNSSYAWTGVSAYQYQAPSTVAQFQADAPQTPSAGTLATAGCPIDTCCVVSLRSSTPGRSHRGRMYVPLHTAVPAAGALWIASTTNTVGTATKALFSSILGGTAGGVCVVSRTHNTYDLLTTLITDNKPDVQRRRENRILPTNTQVLAFP